MKISDQKDQDFARELRELYNLEEDEVFDRDGDDDENFFE